MKLSELLRYRREVSGEARADGQHRALPTQDEALGGS